MNTQSNDLNRPQNNGLYKRRERVSKIIREQKKTKLVREVQTRKTDYMAFIEV